MQTVHPKDLIQSRVLHNFILFSWITCDTSWDILEAILYSVLLLLHVKWRQPLLVHGMTANSTGVFLPECEQLK